ncbi:Type II/IV secretion system protein [Candidatus Gugararchaeum adminiculabundum]|nr:Type II/IV secretion system protein [Candidatus Gugararchaeum adminiculabundum]
MCILRVEGKRAVMDCAVDSIEMFTSDCVHSHLKALTTLSDLELKTLRYEEEIIVEYGEEKASVILEYIDTLRQIEGILLDPTTYGSTQDEEYDNRKKLLKRFYEYAYMSPQMAYRVLADYNEPQPQRSLYVEGWRKFRAWVNGIMKSYSDTQMYKMCLKFGDIRSVFLELANLRSALFLESLLLKVPADAKPLTGKDAVYDLGHGIRARIYELPVTETYLYIHENPEVDNLSPELQKILKEEVEKGMQEALPEGVDFGTYFDERTRDFRAHFIDRAEKEKIKITPMQAMAMAREASAWTVGLGSPIENMSLDRANITDVYIDGENAPLYIEHIKFGLCHTLWRYNKAMMQGVVKNIISTTKGTRKFDQNNPVVDVVLTRLNMRCHLQRPPATFRETQAALRMTKETPFTYAQYLYNKSMSAFSAGYDDLMVTLGCSEAVLGLKGVGKTAFTAAKVLAIGQKRRILPIQDIEEIPTMAYRKRGFHMGAMRVQSSDKEVTSSTELDLVAMANASLRMGDSCLIINEIRSRLAIQGIINLLNTQPGVFVLYNLHAESLRDVQDRLELVFGVPSASMFTTDRYSFLKKVRFGRKGRVYRLLGKQYETDQEQHKFAEIFSFKRGESIDDSKLECEFVANPEANLWDLSGVNIAKLEKDLKVHYIPPALARRAEESGIKPEQYIVQAFMKGKMYSTITKKAVDSGNNGLLEIDFVLKCNMYMNKLLKEKEKPDGSIDFAEIDRTWEKQFPLLVSEYERETLQAKGKPEPEKAKKAAAEEMSSVEETGEGEEGIPDAERVSAGTATRKQEKEKPKATEKEKPAAKKKK